MAKLYHRASRFLVRRMVPRYREKLLKWGLTLKPGDIINDCTGFNARIIAIHPDIRYTNRGWYIMNFDLDVTPYGGSCSLSHCGIVPAVPRDKVESDWLEWAECYINEGYLAKWWGNDKKAFEKDRADIQRRIDILKSGGHITNEFGMILKDFSKYQESFME
jgi:hypothetical protein